VFKRRIKMKTKSLKLTTLALLAAGALVALIGGKSPEATEDMSSTGMGSADTLMARYATWETAYVKSSGEGNIVLPLTPSRTLSTEFLDARGQAKINVKNGAVDVEVKGLPKTEGWDVWVIDNISGPNMSVMPESGDNMIRIGSLKHEGDVARLLTSLDSETTASIDPDMAVVTRAGKTPTQERTLGGIITLYQELYLSGQRGNFGVLNDVDPEEPKPAEEKSLFGSLIDAIMPSAKADIGPIPNPSTPLQQLINAGRISFFNETFQGNGRTCGTCHREDQNFTIDAEFIATLPPNDPLFAAEFIPALAQNFENPVLMRNFGLILENVDGLDDLPNKFVMRGIPHTLALLDNTLEPVAGGGDGTTTPPNERTGWGGDGAPVSPPGQPFLLFDGNVRHADGSLIDFIIGAIIQHYPKTLARRPFTFPGAAFDFRLPTQAELNELVAFQKSTGRKLDPDLSILQLKGAVPRRGQEIFNNPGSVLGQPNEGAGKCFFCHLNAGASDFFFPGQNANFNTNVEQLPDQPADLIQPPQPNPPDGGFGTGTPPPGVFGIGNGSFNTPVLVEAADTGPFFHNNAVETIEGAVDFYNSEAFNQPPGFGAAIGGIRLEATQVVAVAAFLRVLNAAENIRSTGDISKRAKLANITQGRELLRLAISEANDGLEVLNGGGLHGDAQIKLRNAINFLTQAFNQTSVGTRNARIDQAIAQLNGAMTDMILVNVPAFQF
jgi:hypothetical protein